MIINRLADGLKAFETFVPLIYKSFVSLIKVILISDLRVKIPATQERTCFVLGNGPSLQESLREYDQLFHKYDLFSVNHFAAAEEYVHYQPGSYVLLDPGFFIESAQNDSRVNETIDKIVSETKWSMYLYIPRSAKGWSKIKYLKTNKNIQIVFFNYTIVNGFDPLSFFLYRRNLGFPVCQNVLGASILLALNIGYQEIFLFGADHSWIKDLRVNEDNELYLTHRHFYSAVIPTKHVKISDPVKNTPVTLGQFFVSCFKVFDVYYVLERYAKHRKSRISNASDGSFIDAFERRKPK